MMSKFSQLKSKAESALNEVQDKVSNLSLNNSRDTSLNNSQTNLCPAPTLDIPPLPGHGYHGPYLKFGGTKNNSYSASVLIVTPESNPPPTLLTSTNLNVNAIRLAIYHGCAFHRYDLVIPQSEQETPVEYWFSHDHGRRLRFVVPGWNTEWKFFFSSCNGFSLEYTPAQRQAAGGIQPLWRDVMEKHQQRAFHVHLGGGDQIYNDPVFVEVPELVHWCHIPRKEEKERAGFTNEMSENVKKFYLKNYLNHFNEEIFRDALAQIPYVFNQDDHDLFDGFGSYPSHIQQHPIVQGVGAIAIDFYLLFQHHTTRQMARQDGYFGARGFNFVRSCGESNLLLGIDTRCERSLQTIVEKESWRMIEEELRRYSNRVEHLIVILGIPTAYPRLKGEQLVTVAADITQTIAKGLNTVSTFISEKTNKSIDLASPFKKTGAYKSVVNHFGEGELADDLNDHWTAEIHNAERSDMIDLFVELSKEKRWRTSILTGSSSFPGFFLEAPSDVHCGGMSYFCNPGVAASSDPAFIPNLISSAIGNLPPPAAVITALHRCYKPLPLALARNGTVQETVHELFVYDVDGKPLNEKRLIPRRNWCILERRGRELRMELRVEGIQKDTASVKGYEYLVPALG
ncbi:hypothetical protein BKA69DRAFT_1123823 [Paraphysoderma sedebokerense]|nr:hypothetical protein BKA69DRAFT_1123823 [Paraphysoderma sedebokerense]